MLTSLLDHVAFPADEIATLYHERWELEFGYLFGSPSTCEIFEPR